MALHFSSLWLSGETLDLYPRSDSQRPQSKVSELTIQLFIKGKGFLENVAVVTHTDTDLRTRRNRTHRFMAEGAPSNQLALSKPAPRNVDQDYSVSLFDRPASGPYRSGIWSDNVIKPDALNVSSSLS